MMRAHAHMISPQDVNETVRDEWARELGSRRLADLLIADPRLANGVLQRLAKVAGHNGIQPIHEGDADAIALLHADMDRVVRLCGLVIHGGQIARQVSGPAFRALTTNFDTQELRFASASSEFHAVASDEPLVADYVVRRVMEAGAACLDAWRQGASPEILAHMDMVGVEFPELPEDVAAVEEDYAFHLIDHVINHILEHGGAA